MLSIRSVHDTGRLPDEYVSDEDSFFPENLMAEYQWIRNHLSTLQREHLYYGKHDWT
ncbi:MAG: hypothetical protein ACYC5K_10485 [Saccharofermentanales bacterium]